MFLACHCVDTLVLGSDSLGNSCKKWKFRIKRPYRKEMPLYEIGYYYSIGRENIPPIDRNTSPVKKLSFVSLLQDREKKEKYMQGAVMTSLKGRSTWMSYLSF